MFEWDLVSSLSEFLGGQLVFTLALGHLGQLGQKLTVTVAGTQLIGQRLCQFHIVLQTHFNSFRILVEYQFKLEFDNI